MIQYREINPEPTDIQRATWRKHKAAGTSPGNPKWYRPRVFPKPFTFTPNRAPVFPRLGTGAAFNTAHNPQTARRTLETRYKDGTTLTKIL